MSAENRPTATSPTMNGRTPPEQGAPATFSFQETLPRLPIPELQETCEKFLQWTGVLLDEKECERTRQVVADFQGHAGPKLHDRLLQWSRSPGVASWLESFWDHSYLSYRKPLCINSNVFYLLYDIPALKKFSFTRQVTMVLMGILELKDLIDTQRLPVDMDRDQPLCMEQYRKLFSTTRIPARDCDHRVNPFDSEHPVPMDARHIVVLSKGWVYSLDVLSPEGTPEPAERIEKSLRAIVEESASEPCIEPIGILTTLDRNRWARGREELSAAHPDNAGLLQTLETALFALCLDDVAPQDSTHVARVMMHGDGKNRWFDKSFQLVACPNGVYGVNAEHSGLDGSIIGTMLNIITRQSFDHDWRDTVEGECRVRRLSFQLDDTVRGLIKEADRDFAAMVDDTRVKVLIFRGFGKNGIKKLQISPDAFVQMALQRAQHRLFGKCFSTYEPVMTRRFLHGRTEAVRTVTEESVAFVDAMASDAVHDRTRAELLKKAARTHVARLTECRNGMGIQRHIFGMLNMYRRHGDSPGIESMPELFTDTAWTRMCHDVFSTSTSDPAGLALAGYGPVVDDGFGFRYVTKNDSIHITMSSRTACGENLEMLYTYIEEAFYELKRVLESVSEGG